MATEVSGVALIIGAGSGIGLESALVFAERGARAVIFADLELEAAQAGSQKSKSIATAKDYSTLAFGVDVRDRASIDNMVAEIKNKFGRIDYAVNCAGVPRQKEADLSTLDEAEYDLLHDVNAKGLLHCLQAEINVMKDQESLSVQGRNGSRKIGPGSIICITSLSAVLAAPKSATYTASKFAARGIIKCAALENLRSGLRINEVCPGFTNTPMLQRGIEQQPAVGQIINKSMPLGRIAEPEEIAHVVHFLASPGASFVNGQTLVVDSGVSISKYA
ncbi:hypothetical protein QQS21_000455 [Conoideocrella luteorostrata]|uniref:Ketoreductase domain-containing protein n=1 Tax=Conoideocrella luteorostrata TaxID=1105319 RepID=A0AAJ0D124_9HYPO|nr:hypothetical protein QQS21_000455 [Conoideocrella luteorostrata]